MIELRAGLVLVSTVFLLACNERTTDQEILVYDPPDPTADAGVDMGELPPGDECDGPEGSTCRLPRAFGVCLSGRCSLVACVSGFTDCDQDRTNGCEVAVDVEDSCGGCGVICQDAERCQLGELGYLCAAEPVCRPGSIDLDLVQGCEWSSSWSQGRGLPTAGYRAYLLFERSDGTVWTAGLIDDETAAAAPLDESALDLGVPAPSDPPVGYKDDENELLIAFPTGVARIPAEDSQTSFTPVLCASEAEVVDVSISTVVSLIATEHELLGWSNRDTCIDCPPEGTDFGPEDYLRAFWPGTGPYALDEDEVAQCTPCSFDPVTDDPLTDADCHPDACRIDGEPTNCATCNPVGCPTFDVVRVLQNGRTPRVYVVTRRGLLVFVYRSGWELQARFEEPFVPGVAPGRAFVDAVLFEEDADDVVRLLDNAGRLLSVRIALDGTVESATPGISIGSGSRLVRSNGVDLVRSSTADYLIGSDGPSAAIHRLTLDDGPSIAELDLMVAGATTEGFLLLYETQGLVFERRITLD